MFGDMVKLVDTHASGACGSNAVRVQISLSPQIGAGARVQCGSNVVRVRVSLSPHCLATINTR